MRNKCGNLLNNFGIMDVYCKGVNRCALMLPINKLATQVGRCNAVMRSISFLKRKQQSIFFRSQVWFVAAWFVWIGTSVGNAINWIIYEKIKSTYFSIVQTDGLSFIWWQISAPVSKWSNMLCACDGLILFKHRNCFDHDVFRDVNMSRLS